MALKSKNPMDDLIKRSSITETNTASFEPTKEKWDEEDALDEEIVERRVRQLMSKKQRTLQRSLKIDKRMAAWLNNVKEHQREVEGIPRPCLDDLMYDAIKEYLNNHYKELEP